MNPARWERMSWHARQQYLTTLTAREEWIERQTHRLSIERERWTAHITDPDPDLDIDLAPDPQADTGKPPAWDPAANLEEARRLYARIHPDPPHVIKQRINQLVEATTRGHNQCTTRSQSAA